MKLLPRKVLTFLWSTAALLAASTSAEALLASVKATGMAATMTSYPMDSLAGAANPSSIVDVQDRLDVEGAWDQTGQSTTIEGNRFQTGPVLNPLTNGFYDGAKTSNFYVGNFGINKHLECVPCDITVGLVLYNRNFVKTTYGKPNLLLGTSPAGLEYAHEVLSPMIAFRVLQNHSFGVSLNFNFQRLKVNGLQNFNNALFSSHPGFVTNNNYNWSSGVGVTVGWMSRFFCDTLRIGASYTPYTHMSKFGRYRGFVAQSGKFNLPQRAQAGISWKWIPCSTVAFDVEYVDWNQIKALANNLPESLVVTKLGTNDGAGFGFRHQIFYRVGADYTFGSYAWGCTPLWDAFTLRAGFRHVNHPFKSDNTAVNSLTLDTVKDFVTVGFTVYRGAFEISSFYAHGFQSEINGSDSIPALLGFGEANLKQRKDILGLAVGYKF